MKEFRIGGYWDEHESVRYDTFGYCSHERFQPDNVDNSEGDLVVNGKVERNHQHAFVYVEV